MALDKRDVRSLVAADFLNTEVNSAAIAASASVLDDWDETDRAKVNLIVGQAGIAAGAGAVGVTVPRVTLASDDPAVSSLSVLDDWDETNRAAVNTIAGQVGVQGGAGAVTALTQRVVIATDQTAIPVTLDAVPGSPTAAFDETASLAAQASETLDFALGSNVTAHLESVTIASDVAWVALISKVDETPTTTNVARLHGEPGATVQWSPEDPEAALFTVASDGTPTAKYSVAITNNGISAVGSSGVVSVTLEKSELAN